MNQENLCLRLWICLLWIKCVANFLITIWLVGDMPTWPCLVVHILIQFLSRIYLNIGIKLYFTEILVKLYKSHLMHLWYVCQTNKNSIILYQTTTRIDFFLVVVSHRQMRSDLIFSFVQSNFFSVEAKFQDERRLVAKAKTAEQAGR